MSLINHFKKFKHWNRYIIRYGVINEEGCLMKKNLVLSPSLSNCSKDSWKLLSLFIFINWPSLVTKWFIIQKIYSKMHPVSCTNTYPDMTDLLNHGMVKNDKILIPWERKTTFRGDKKNSQLVYKMTCFEKLSSCRGGNL